MQPTDPDVISLTPGTDATPSRETLGQFIMSHEAFIHETAVQVDLYVQEVTPKHFVARACFFNTRIAFMLATAETQDAAIDKLIAAVGTYHGDTDTGPVATE